MNTFLQASEIKKKKDKHNNVPLDRSTTRSAQTEAAAPEKRYRTVQRVRPLATEAPPQADQSAPREGAAEPVEGACEVG